MYGIIFLGSVLARKPQDDFRPTGVMGKEVGDLVRRDFQQAILRVEKGGEDGWEARGGMGARGGHADIVDFAVEDHPAAVGAVVGGNCR
jgi:hypothetical protein